MKKFQTGVRGYHLDDESEAKMRDTMKYLPSDQDQLDILALITKLANEYPVKKTPIPANPGVAVGVFGRIPFIHDTQIADSP